MLSGVGDETGGGFANARLSFDDVLSSVRQRRRRRRPFLFPSHSSGGEGRIWPSGAGVQAPHWHLSVEIRPLESSAVNHAVQPRGSMPVRLRSTNSSRSGKDEDKRAPRLDSAHRTTPETMSFRLLRIDLPKSVCRSDTAYVSLWSWSSSLDHVVEAPSPAAADDTPRHDPAIRQVLRDDGGGPRIAALDPGRVISARAAGRGGGTSAASADAEADGAR
ncbi:hypothetical protein THAOC_22658, partial [Thalassiosira oceanica]